jgi:hypothetical protein
MENKFLNSTPKANLKDEDHVFEAFGKLNDDKDKEVKNKEDMEMENGNNGDNHDDEGNPDHIILS